MVNVRISNILFTYIDGTWAKVQVIEYVLDIMIREKYFLLTQMGPGLKVQVIKCVLNIKISNIPLTYLQCVSKY